APARGRFVNPSAAGHAYSKTPHRKDPSPSQSFRHEFPKGIISKGHICPCFDRNWLYKSNLLPAL
ncbi:MAG: hypothetical protein ABSG78_13735, partial [Verrucomicrobiota bacterium]